MSLSYSNRWTCWLNITLKSRSREHTERNIITSVSIIRNIPVELKEMVDTTLNNINHLQSVSNRLQARHCALLSHERFPDLSCFEAYRRCADAFLLATGVCVLYMWRLSLTSVLSFSCWLTAFPLFLLCTVCSRTFPPWLGDVWRYLFYSLHSGLPAVSSECVTTWPLLGRPHFGLRLCLV